MLCWCNIGPFGSLFHSKLFLACFFESNAVALNVPPLQNTHSFHLAITLILVLITFWLVVPPWHVFLTWQVFQIHSITINNHSDLDNFIKYKGQFSLCSPARPCIHYQSLPRTMIHNSLKVFSVQITTQCSKVWCWTEWWKIQLVCLTGSGSLRSLS